MIHHRQIGRLLTLTPKDNDDDDNQSSLLLSSSGLTIQGAAPRAGEIVDGIVFNTVITGFTKDQ